MPIGRQIDFLVGRAIFYEKPIHRPPQSTPAQSVSEINAVALPESGAVTDPFASATRRRTVKVKATAENRHAIFTQKGTL